MSKGPDGLCMSIVTVVIKSFFVNLRFVVRKLALRSHNASKVIRINVQSDGLKLVTLKATVGCNRSWNTNQAA